ncbi:MAG: TerD family protein [Fusobacteriaceae bacterium]
MEIINLNKGEAINLSKVSNGAQVFEIGTGWDIGVWEYTDIDVMAVLVKEDGTGKELVYFGNLSSNTGAVKLSGDNRTGKGAGYDEVLTLDVSKLPDDVNRIPVIVSVYSGADNFGLVENFSIDVNDKSTSSSLASFIPELEASLSRSIVLGEFVKDGSDFHFKAYGKGYPTRASSLSEYGFTF